MILFPVQLIFRLRTPTLKRPGEARDRNNTVTDIDKITPFPLAAPVKPLPGPEQIPKVTKGFANAQDESRAFVWLMSISGRDRRALKANLGSSFKRPGYRDLYRFEPQTSLARLDRSAIYPHCRRRGVESMTRIGLSQR